MTVYTISQNEMNQNAIALPPALVGYLSENDYVYICQRFRGVESEACCFALLVSMVLCLCITPIALLLCPCFVTCRVTSERKRIANDLNLQLFRGFQVIEANEFSGVLIHTDRIPGAAATSFAPVSYVHQQQPVMVSNEFVHVQPMETVAYPPQPPSSQADGSLNKQEYATTSPMAVGVQPVAATPRMMTIQVPANVYPGQLLRVRSPEGTFFDVTIPQGVGAGESILIPY